MESAIFEHAFVTELRAKYQLGELGKGITPTQLIILSGLQPDNVNAAKNTDVGALTATQLLRNIEAGYSPFRPPFQTPSFYEI